MTQNPALRALGFSDRDRVVVIHADDVAMCGATVDAFLELTERGATSSGSVMVPCPSFPEAVAGCRGCSDIDVGVHLTLTSEWAGYRWGPISTRDPASGLVDDEGYFYRSQDLWAGPDPGAVRTEIEAQVDLALTQKLDLTHLDHHMFSMLSPTLISHYVGLGFARQLPVLMTRQPQWVAILGEAAIAGWEEQGLPVFDHLRELPLTEMTGSHKEMTKTMIDKLPPGLTYLITHPATDTPQLRAIAGDWRQRVADFETLRSEDLKNHLRNSEVQVIGWRPLRQLMHDRCLAHDGPVPH